MNPKALKITTLGENIAYGKCLGQWGWSFLIELVDVKDEKRKIAFETGISKKALLCNIKALEVNLSDIDSIILSRGHLDHTVATVEVAKFAGSVSIFAHPDTFPSRFYEDEIWRQKNG